MTIQYKHGNGFTAKAWRRGETQRAVVRKHMRRLYGEGIQCAFRYYEDKSIYVVELRRLAAWLARNDD